MAEKMGTEIGKYIKKYRENLGLTQTEVASKANIAQASMCQFENGSKIPSAVTLKVLADILGVTPNDLYGISTKSA